ncbi:MAG: ABC transporter substrate-binding protein [Alphaproteobacteria bacterium]|nr:ABC transporter substrate-binding protein [Alphaproteobacteria bacterium]
MGMPRSAWFAVLLAVAPVAGAAAVESREPIRIAVHDWTGQQITARLAGGILERMGYTVRYVVTDYLKGLEAVIAGRVTLETEQWDTTAHEAIARAEATGKVERLGALGPRAVEDWWYPLYMKERCPGLPDWRALLQCGEAFATPDTAPKGRYLGLPGVWGGNDQERIEALGLPFVMVDALNEEAMFADLRDAYARKAPLMVWVYSPHWIGARFAGEWVQFPKYEPACYTDPKWGINPDKAYDCGKPSGQIWKFAATDMAKKWPAAHRMMKQFRIAASELEGLVAEVDLERQPVPAVAARWIAEHEAQWKPWTVP